MASSRSISLAMSLSIFLATGCVNLDERDPSPFRFGQKTKNGQTVASKGDTKKSVSKMEQAASPSGFTSKVKDAWPFKRKTRMTVSEMPMAENDPTRLDYMPGKVGPDLYVAAAKMSEKAGNYKKALEQYDTALKSDGRNRNALIGLARLQHGAGKTDDAIRVYRSALDIYRNDAVIMNDLGICYARRGQLNEAIAMLQAATKAAPDREMYANNLAASLVEANRSREAVAHLSRVGPPAVANYNVGFLLSQGGRKDEAAVFLNQALAIDPNLQQARSLLSEFNPQVSSLPNDLPRPNYDIPVTRSEQQLSAPKQFDRPAQNAPAASAPAQSGPDYLQQAPPRQGPFGFVPNAQVDDIQVVTYVESDVAAKQPSGGLQQVGDVDLFQMSLQQPSATPAGTLVPPHPQN